MILGNDISSAQGIIDFSTYKNNTNFVIMKASEGVGFTDSRFLVNRATARSFHLPVGYYHFARPDLGNTSQNEAAFFLSTIGQLQNGEVLALDYEVSYAGDAVAWCKGFLTEVFNKTGCKPFIYLNQSQQNLDWAPVVSAGYALWLASYTGDPTKNTGNTGKWPTMAIQQWTDAQAVPGISGNVDGDVFFGDVDAFAKYGYQAASTDPLVCDPKSVRDKLVSESAAYEEFVKIGYNQATDVTTRLQQLQSQIDGLNKQCGDLTKQNEALVVEVQQTKDSLAKQADILQQQAASDSIAIDAGLKATEALKNMTIDMNTIAQTFGTSYPPLDGINRGIQTLKNQTHASQIEATTTVQNSQTVIQWILNIFTKKKVK
jgi:GH25 family lysozyme M1 (1,4-beta-N-acetylmuramidase)/regulator of replication initiation timing